MALPQTRHGSTPTWIRTSPLLLVFHGSTALIYGGGVFSIYEGAHKYAHPEPLENLWVAFLVLLFSLGLEGYATYSNVKEINRRRKHHSILRFLTATKDSDLVVVFGENAAATLGLALALASLLFAAITGDSAWDGFGSMLIGFVLIGVAGFLAIEVKSLLVGERASPDVEQFVTELAAHHPGVTRLLRILSIQQGPGQVLLLLKLGFDEKLTFGGVAETINQFETEIRAAFPEVRWCFIEPDRPR